MSILKKIWRMRWKLRSLPATLYFNFHYLPFKQALKLPILLYKPSLKSMKGRVEIKGPVRHGMVILGIHSVSVYPSNGIIYENNGGTITFGGKCIIGSNSALSIGSKGHLEIGNDLMANSSIKVICYHHITIGDNCRLGWENMVMDTDFHTLTRPDGTQSRGYGSVEIGHNCWLGTGCLTLKNAVLPPYTTVQARTVISRRMDIPQRCVIGADTAVKVKATDTWRDLAHDKPEY